MDSVQTTPVRRRRSKQTPVDPQWQHKKDLQKEDEEIKEKNVSVKEFYCLVGDKLVKKTKMKNGSCYSVWIGSTSKPQVMAQYKKLKAQGKVEAL